MGGFVFFAIVTAADILILMKSVQGTAETSTNVKITYAVISGICDQKPFDFSFRRVRVIICIRTVGISFIKSRERLESIAYRIALAFLNVPSCHQDQENYPSYGSLQQGPDDRD